MNTDSPINYWCPTCGALNNVPCTPGFIRGDNDFHTARRAARMQALARRSAHPSTLADSYERGNCNHGDRTLGHRTTTFKRPDPTLPFDDTLGWCADCGADGVPYGHTCHTITPREAWEDAVREAVDLILEGQE